MTGGNGIGSSRSLRALEDCILAVTMSVRESEVEYSIPVQWKTVIDIADHFSWRLFYSLV